MKSDAQGLDKNIYRELQNYEEANEYQACTKASCATWLTAIVISAWQASHYPSSPFSHYTRAYNRGGVSSVFIIRLLKQFAAESYNIVEIFRDP